MHTRLGSFNHSTTVANIANSTSDLNNEELTALQQTVSTIAQENRKKIVEHIDSVNYTRLMLTISLWIQTIGKHTLSAETLIPKQDNMVETLPIFAQTMLQLYHNKLLKQEQSIQNGTEAERHTARIAAKKVRYATECFESILPKKRTRAYIKALTRLQEIMGKLNDSSVADRLLRQIETNNLQGAGFVRGYLAATTRTEIAVLHKCWKKFIAIKPPYKK